MLKLAIVLYLVVSVSTFKKINIYKNGQQKSIEKAPYRVSVTYEDKSHCSGALISKDWVLTTAVCLPIFYDNGSVDEIELIKFKVKVGAPLLSGRGQIVTVKKAHAFHDVVILRLTKDVDLSEYVQIIPLANINIKENDTVFIAGWDKFYGSSYSNFFAAIEGTLVPQNMCYDYTSFSYNHNGFCVKNDDKFCEAETGSPVVVDGKLIGLVHFFGACEDPDNYPLYIIGVPEHFGWIQDNTRKW